VTIPQRQDEINAFVKEFFTKPEPSGKGSGESVSSALSDDQVIELCRKAKNAAKFAGLFDDGDISAYDYDDSVADVA
jgi:primase-polymerase (primpol)-like protein